VAVPSSLSVRETPVGNAPVSVIAAAGKPVVVTVNEPAEPITSSADAGEVIDGAVPM